MPKRSRRLLTIVAAVLLGLAVPIMPPTAEPAAAASINSAGPLTQINISPDLNCDVRHVSDAQPEWFGATACGTFIASGGTLWGPANVPAGGSASPRTGFTPVSSVNSGSGTNADPYQLTTVVDLPGSPLRLTQVDTYVVGREDYITTVTLSNPTAAPVTGIVYTAGDCYLQNSDYGYGRISGTAAICSTSPTAGGRIEGLIPITAGNHWQQDGYSTIWSVIGSQTHFRDTCRCTSYIDNGAGLSWDLSVPAGGTASYAWNTVFSPAGTTPLTIRAAADNDSSRFDTTNGYVVTVCNVNVQEYTLTSLTVALPASFTYNPAHQVGFHPGPPLLQGGNAVWTGSVVVPAGGCKQVHFSVNVGFTLGTFTIDVAGTADGIPVTGVAGAAPITVLGPAPTELADLSLAKSATPEPVIAGAPITFTVTVTNLGPALSQPFILTDLLPVTVTLSSYDSRCQPPQPVADTPQTVRISCAGEPLASNASTTYTFVGATAGGLNSGSLIVNSATVEIQNGLFDPNPENDTATSVSNVERQVNVGMGLAFNPDWVYQGDTSTLSIRAYNEGPSTANNTTFTVTLPPGISFENAAKGTPDCVLQAQQLSCTLPYFAAGDFVFDMVVRTAPDSGGNPWTDYTASATISADEDSNPDDNTGSAILHVLGVIAVTGAKTWPVILTGLLLLAAGTTLILLTTRRRRPHPLPG